MVGIVVLVGTKAPLNQMLFYVLNSSFFYITSTSTPEEVKRNKLYFLIFLIAIDV